MPDLPAAAAIGYGSLRQLHIDPDPAGRQLINRAIEAAAAVDPIVAAHAFEVFGGPGRVVAAVEKVVEIRTADAVDTDEAILADRGVADRDTGSTRRCEDRGVPAVGIERDDDAGGGMKIGNPGLAIA